MPDFAKYKRVYQYHANPNTSVTFQGPLTNILQEVQTPTQNQEPLPEQTSAGFRWTSHGAQEAPYSAPVSEQATVQTQQTAEQTSAPQSSNPQYTQEKAKAAVQWALSKIGRPYVWGAKGEGDKFDCSGLTYAAWKAQGVDVPASTGVWKQGKKTKVEKDKGQPGDVIILNTNGPSKGHAMMITANLGDGKYKVVEAKGKKYGVVESTYTVGSNLHGIYRAKKGTKLIKKYKYEQFK